MQITTSHRALGRHVGSGEGRVEFVRGKADEWTRRLSRLSAVTEKLPQDANAAFTKSLSREWGYIQRVVPQCGPALSPIEEAITESFLLKLFGSEVCPAER